jgi:hypothetical protein
VSVQITDRQSRPIVPERHDARRDDADTSCSKPVLAGWQIIDLEREPRCRGVIAGLPASRGAGSPMRRAPPPDEVLSPRRPRPGWHQAVPAPGRD